MSQSLSKENKISIDKFEEDNISSVLFCYFKIKNWTHEVSFFFFFFKSSVYYLISAQILKELNDLALLQVQ